MLFLVYVSAAFAQETTQQPIVTTDYVTLFTNLGGLGSFAWLIYTRVKEIGQEQKEQMEALRAEVKDSVAGLRSDLRNSHEDSQEIIKAFYDKAEKNGKGISILLDRVKTEGGSVSER